MNVYLYRKQIDLTDAEEFLLAHCNDVSPERALQISRYRDMKDKLRSYWAEMLLRQAVQDRGLSMEQLRFASEQFGKPILVNMHTNQKIAYDYNLSHSGDHVVCAISESRVGVDIQEYRGYKPTLVKRCCSPKEQEYLFHLNKKEQNSEFYRLWTLKESYMKSTGEGLRVPLDHIEFTDDDPVKVIRQGISMERCCATTIHLADGYSMSVCLMEEQIAPVWMKQN